MLDLNMLNRLRGLSSQDNGPKVMPSPTTDNNKKNSVDLSGLPKRFQDFAQQHDMDFDDSHFAGHTDEFGLFIRENDVPKPLTDEFGFPIS